MLVYQALKSEFMDDVERDVIVERVTSSFERLIHRANPSEVTSWRHSLEYMYKVLNTSEVPDGCGVAIEFGVPYTSSRIDFLLTGRSTPEHDSAVIIELKQWESLEAIPTKDAVVRTWVGHANREVPHPSYQAWSYARMIGDYNEGVRDEQIELRPCAYLHNYQVSDGYDPLLDPAYLDYLEKAPAFCNGDVLKLRDFICRSIKQADHGNVLYAIESGRLRPSKSLQDALTSMLEGNEEFVMIDDQKVVFETALQLAREARATGEKCVFIVQGGPGTGKSVIAINLLVRLTAEDMVSQYVSKNSAPRNVYSKKLLAGDRSRAYINGLFRGPGTFYEYSGALLDAVVVDEAHRLNEKSGLFGNLGENQIMEIIAAARFAVFFIDDAQRVTIKDAGSVDHIRGLAENAGARVVEDELSSQFRCNGSNGYLDWLDDALGIKDVEDPVVDLDYDFRIFEDPNELFAAVAEKNATNNRSRVVAGYCWEWPTSGRGNPNSHDIVLPDMGFSKSWNLDATGTWAIDEGSIQEVGCVHTAQGLEFDYVGVIVGDDLRFENGAVVTDYTRRARSDASLKGIKSLAKTDPERAHRIADEVIRNTYRVLMTRGMKGCYVFCTDRALAEHLRAKMPSAASRGVYTVTPTAVPMAAEDPLGD